MGSLRWERWDGNVDEGQYTTTINKTWRGSGPADADVEIVILNDLLAAIGQMWTNASMVSGLTWPVCAWCHALTPHHVPLGFNILEKNLLVITITRIWRLGCICDYKFACAHSHVNIFNHSQFQPRNLSPRCLQISLCSQLWSHLVHIPVLFVLVMLFTPFAGVPGSERAFPSLECWVQISKI